MVYFAVDFALAIAATGAIGYMLAYSFGLRKFEQILLPFLGMVVFALSFLVSFGLSRLF